MNDQNQTKNSLFTEIKQEEAANVNGGLGLLTDRSIVSQISAQNQLNRNGFTNIAGWGRVIRTRYRGWGYSTTYKKYVRI